MLIPVRGNRGGQQRSAGRRSVDPAPSAKNTGMVRAEGITEALWKDIELRCRRP